LASIYATWKQAEQLIDRPSNERALTVVALLEVGSARNANGKQEAKPTAVKRRGLARIQNRKSTGSKKHFQIRGYTM
jgi:hypothetical protein